MMRVNYEMPVKLTHHYGGRMVERGRGAVILVNALNSLWLPSALFHWMLDGEEVKSGFRHRPGLQAPTSRDVQEDQSVEQR